MLVCHELNEPAIRARISPHTCQKIGERRHTHPAPATRAAQAAGACDAALCGAVPTGSPAPGHTAAAAGGSCHSGSARLGAGHAAYTAPGSRASAILARLDCACGERVSERVSERASGSVGMATWADVHACGDWSTSTNVLHSACVPAEEGLL